MTSGGNTSGARYVRSRRQFLRDTAALGVGLAGVGGIASACGGDDDSSGSDGITFVRYGDAGAAKIWTKMVELFNKDHPDIKVTVRNIAADSWAAFFDAVSVQIAGGQVPDVVHVATEGQRLFISRNLVEPIDQYVERDKAELAPYFEDVHPNLIKWTNDLTSPGDETFYLPHGFNTMCVHYSTEIFQKAGVDEPGDDWSWDDFLAISRQLKAKLPQTFAMAVGATHFAGAAPWLFTNGANLFNDDWTQATADTPEAVEAAEFMRQLVAEGLSPKPGGEFDAFTAMTQGKLAMFGGGRWPTVTLRSLNYVDKVKIVPWPQKTKQGSPVGWDAYPILKGSKNKDAAWEFVKFMCSAEATKLYAEQTGTIVPPLKSIAQSDAFLKNAPAGSEKLYEALTYATPIPSPDEGSAIEHSIIDSFTQVLTGNVKPDAALKQLNQQIQAKL